MLPKLLFLHGGPGYPDYLEGFFAGKFFADMTTEFYTQLQGHDVALLQLIEQLAEKIADQNSILIGHSWGGVLALEYLQQTLDTRVKGIVILGSFLCGDDATIEYEKELQILGLSNPTLEQIFFSKKENGLAAKLLKILENDLHEPTFKKLWGEVIPDYDAIDFLKQSSIPVLNIFGSRDIRIPARRVRTYAQLRNGITNVEVTDAGHFPFITNEDRHLVVSTITKFAEECERH